MRAPTRSRRGRRRGVEELEGVLRLLLSYCLRIQRAKPELLVASKQSSRGTGKQRRTPATCRPWRP